MNPSEAESDVIVVGAGIGGAVLALALGQRGWKIKLLERDKQPPRIARPEILWGATPRALDRLGIGERIRTQASVRLAGIEATEGERRLVTVSSDLMRRAGAEAFSTDPAASRAVILDAALATGNVTLLRGAEVTELLPSDGLTRSVRGTIHGRALAERARLVVGDDGARSRARESLAIRLETKIFPLDFITAAIRWPSELPADRARIFLRPSALRRGLPGAGFVPWPAGEGALLIPLPHDRVERVFADGTDAFWSSFSELTSLAARLREQLRFPDDFTRVRRPFGHAARYVSDCAAVIGDAAHPVSPVGGQGANASIADALVLAEVAHEGLLAGDLSCKRLARYEALRRPANARSVAFTVRGARAFAVLSRAPGLSWIVRVMLAALEASPPLKRRLLRAASTTFVGQSQQKGTA